MWECKKFVLIVIFSLSLLGNCRADGFYFDCDLRGTVFLENSEKLPFAEISVPSL